MMRWRPKPQGGRQGPSGPLPENPYRRFFTRTPTFETLVRRARSAQKAQPGQPKKP